MNANDYLQRLLARLLSPAKPVQADKPVPARYGPLNVKLALYAPRQPGQSPSRPVEVAPSTLAPGDYRDVAPPQWYEEPKVKPEPLAYLAAVSTAEVKPSPARISQELGRIKRKTTSVEGALTKSRKRTSKPKKAKKAVDKPESNA